MATLTSGRRGRGKHKVRATGLGVDAVIGAIGAEGTLDSPSASMHSGWVREYPRAAGA